VERASYRTAVAETLKRCASLPFTEAVGNGMAGQSPYASSMIGNGPPTRVHRKSMPRAGRPTLSRRTRGARRAPLNGRWRASINQIAVT
jgi:hypothetical protein